MTEDGDAASRLRALGWRQGTIIKIAPGSQAAQQLGAEALHAVVASQDCDIVAPMSTEPCVDLLPASIVKEAAGDLRYGKNPRRLCLELINREFAIVDIRGRRTVAKAALAETAATESCLPADRKLLAKWLGKRYSRAAFPDELNVRLEAQKRKLTKLSKHQAGKFITAILLMLDTEEELAGDQDYKVVVWLAARTEVADDPKQRPALEKYSQEFARTVGACHGIDVVECELRSELDISLEDLRVMKRFDFDYRSDAPDPGGETSPE